MGSVSVVSFSLVFRTQPPIATPCALVLECGCRRRCSPGHAHLRTLVLDNQGLTDQDIAPLFSILHKTSIRSVSLRHNFMTVAGAHIVARCILRLEDCLGDATGVSRSSSSSSPPPPPPPPSSSSSWAVLRVDLIGNNSLGAEAAVVLGAAILLRKQRRHQSGQHKDLEHQSSHTQSLPDHQRYRQEQQQQQQHTRHRHHRPCVVAEWYAQHGVDVCAPIQLLLGHTTSSAAAASVRHVWHNVVPAFGLPASLLRSGADSSDSEHASDCYYSETTTATTTTLGDNFATDAAVLGYLYTAGEARRRQLEELNTEIARLVDGLRLGGTSLNDMEAASKRLTRCIADAKDLAARLQVTEEKVWAAGVPRLPELVLAADHGHQQDDDPPPFPAGRNGRGMGVGSGGTGPVGDRHGGGGGGGGGGDRGGGLSGRIGGIVDSLGGGAGSNRSGAAGGDGRAQYRGAHATHDHRQHQQQHRPATMSQGGQLVDDGWGGRVPDHTPRNASSDAGAAAVVERSVALLDLAHGRTRYGAAEQRRYLELEQTRQSNSARGQRDSSYSDSGDASVDGNAAVGARGGGDGSGASGDGGGVGNSRPPGGVGGDTMDYPGSAAHFAAHELAAASEAADEDDVLLSSLPPEVDVASALDQLAEQRLRGGSYHAALQAYQRAVAISRAEWRAAGQLALGRRARRRLEGLAKSLTRLADLLLTRDHCAAEAALLYNEVLPYMCVKCSVLCSALRCSALLCCGEGMEILVWRRLTAMQGRTADSRVARPVRCTLAVRGTAHLSSSLGEGCIALPFRSSTTRDLIIIFFFTNAPP